MSEELASKIFQNLRQLSDTEKSVVLRIYNDFVKLMKVRCLAGTSKFSEEMFERFVWQVLAAIESVYLALEEKTDEEGKLTEDSFALLIKNFLKEYDPEYLRLMLIGAEEYSKEKDCQYCGKKFPSFRNRKFHTNKCRLDYYRRHKGAIDPDEH